MSNRLTAQGRTPVQRSFQIAPREEAFYVNRANELRAEAIANMLVGIGRWISKKLAAWGQSVAEARAMRELAGLDDRMLADIGVARSDIPGLIKRVREDMTPEPTPAKPIEQRLAA